MTIWDISNEDSVFVSSAEISDVEDTLTEKQWLKTDDAKIAKSLVKGGKKAIRCGGGYQVFYSIKKANFWNNHS